MTNRHFSSPLKALRILHHLLLKLARVIGRVNNFLLLALSFYLLLLPISLIRRLGRRSRRNIPIRWQPRAPLPRDHYRKQF